MLNISRTRLLAGAAALALTTSLGATPGLAQETATGTMQVTASVAQSCTVASDGDLIFPTPTSTESSVTDSSFTVSCTADGDIQVAIDGGLNLNGGRNMKNSSDDLMPYNLHRDSGLANPWTVDQKFSKLVTGGTPATLEVHGIVTNTNFTTAPAGEYSDTITMTVTF